MTLRLLLTTLARPSRAQAAMMLSAVFAATFGMLASRALVSPASAQDKGARYESYEKLPPLEDADGASPEAAGDPMEGDSSSTPAPSAGPGHKSAPSPVRPRTASPRREPVDAPPTDESAERANDDPASAEPAEPRSRNSTRTIDDDRANRTRQIPRGPRTIEPGERIGERLERSPAEREGDRWDDAPRRPRPAIERAANSGDAAPAGEDDVADVSYFYDALDEGGQWIDHPRYGEVWQPYVDESWRPYTIGRWAYSDDYGWTWLSDEAFGWAVYHYGRWTVDRDDGWIWIPGTEWGPAWVVWRQSDDAIGWAPLPPQSRFDGTRWRADAALFETEGYEQMWVFVRPRYFARPEMRRYIRPRSWTPELVQRTFPRMGLERENRRNVNRGLTLEDYERLSDSTIPRLKIRPIDDPAARRRGRFDGVTERARGEIRLYRPDRKRTEEAVKRAERKAKSGDSATAADRARPLKKSAAIPAGTYAGGKKRADAPAPDDGVSGAKRAPSADQSQGRDKTKEAPSTNADAPRSKPPRAADQSTGPSGASSDSAPPLTGSPPNSGSGPKVIARPTTKSSPPIAMPTTTDPAASSTSETSLPPVNAPVNAPANTNANPNEKAERSSDSRDRERAETSDQPRGDKPRFRADTERRAGEPRTAGTGSIDRAARTNSSGARATDSAGASADGATSGDGPAKPAGKRRWDGSGPSGAPSTAPPDGDAASE
ncbi:MAG: DUF6600 domain-containing protein [Hyphomicrobium sp.]